MKHYAKQMLYEDAQKVKEKIEILENYQAKIYNNKPKK